MRALLAALLLWGCASAPPVADVELDGPAIVRNSPEVGPEVQAAAYVRLLNTADRPDRLVGLSCNCAASVEIHNTFAGEMHTRPSIDIPARGHLEIAPGSPTHLMLMGLRAPIAPGDRINVTLRFEHAAPISVAFVAVENSREAWAAHSANH